MTIQLVLVEPAGPLNVGSVARLCANFGIDGLRLVAPRCDPLGDEARRMAVHGVGMLERAPIYPTLAAAIADCSRVVATSGRGEGEPLPPSPAGAALRWLLRAHDDASPSQILQIATGPAYASLNLSHAVAVVLHELHGCRRQAELVPSSELRGPGGPEDSDAEPCPRGLLEAALADAEALLLEVGYLYPHTAHARMAKLRGLLQRAQIRPQEVALLRGMVCQLRWASRRPCASGEDH